MANLCKHRLSQKSINWKQKYSQQKEMHRKNAWVKIMRTNQKKVFFRAALDRVPSNIMSRAAETDQRGFQNCASSTWWKQGVGLNTFWRLVVKFCLSQVPKRSHARLLPRVRFSLWALLEFLGMNWRCDSESQSLLGPFLLLRHLCYGTFNFLVRNCHRCFHVILMSMEHHQISHVRPIAYIGLLLPNSA